MLIAQIDIPGYCQPKERTFGKSWSTPPKTRAYEKLVNHLAIIAMRDKPPAADFVEVDIRISCEVPKSWSDRKKVRAIRGEMFPTFCDLDNQIKALCDGMNRVVYVDDRFVNSIIAKRVYAETDSARVIVRLMDMD